MTRELDSTPEERAAKRVKDYTDVMWHAATYVIINVFLWLIEPPRVWWRLQLLRGWSNAKTREVPG